MLLEQTLERLTAMKMKGMVAAIEEQLNDPGAQELSFEDRLGLIVDREYLDRENRRLIRRLRDAQLRFQARLEDIEYRGREGLDRAFIQELGTCEWIRRHHNLLIIGATGLGKTFISCALGNRACEQGFRVVTWRTPPLFRELAVGRADGSYPRLLDRLKRTDLLVIDDWGISTLTDSERGDLLEIIEDRYEVGSTVVCSPLPVDKWHGMIGDPTIADSILDRLIHNAYRIELSGESCRRQKHGSNGKKGGAASRSRRG
jgi:DNA replication protein DnaC